MGERARGRRERDYKTLRTSDHHHHSSIVCAVYSEVSYSRHPCDDGMMMVLGSPTRKLDLAIIHDESLIVIYIIH